MSGNVTGTDPRSLSQREARDIAEIHQRLDSIARQVGHLSAGPAAHGAPNNVAQQLNEAISRLDARLSQIAAPDRAPLMQAPQAQAPQAYQAPQTYQAPRMAPPIPVMAPMMSPPMAPPMGPPLAPPQAPGLDLSIAEIIARQGELDGPSPAQDALRRSAPNFVHAAPVPQPYPNFDSIERKLAGITSQIETLRRPDGIEQSISAFRSELADIRHAITEALPRRAIESLEGEIRSLGRRIDETHQNGADSAALGAVERALSEIRSELRSLTPAEQLAGFDDAIRHLGSKIDTIVRTSGDPGTLNQLNEAISALKTIVANIASNEALSQLSENIRTLSQRVDQLSQATHSDMFAALEQRIATLTTTLEQRERPAPADSSHFDNAVRTLSDRLDSLQVGGDAAATFSHVEQRVAHLLERLETSEARSGNLNRVESGLSEIMQMLQQRSAPEAAHASPAMDPAFVDAIRRELSDMRQNQVETTRHTQDSLEVVHNTLGHVVDRLAQIEGDLRQARPAPTHTPPQAPLSGPVPAPQRPAAPTIPPQTRPEMPNPALLQKAAAAERNMGPSPALAKDAAMAGAAPRPTRAPIDPALPPDHPLEPGSRGGARPSAAERIAQSENALRDIPQAKGPVSSSNFIQAARRAAQAAQAAQPSPPAKKATRVTALNDAAKLAATKDAPAQGSRGAKVRALLVGVSVFVIVLGTFKMASNLWHSGETDRASPAIESHIAPPATPSPVEDADGDDGDSMPNAAPDAPSMISPTPIDKQSLNAPLAPPPSQPTQQAATPATAPAIAPAPPAMPPANNDVTGSIAPIGTPAPLPDAIGGPVLRTAAKKGDASAAYEVGLRYAEGRGVTANYDEAAKWYGRAAQANLVPAMFRLGTLYEKGLGVRKDIGLAHRYYRQAADHGNAKAMHNLAVLEADGGGKPNYKNAAYWFLRAAERGVADSQFNLGILYARGIGVEQSLTESYKWFSLAAAQGDADSERKRDDVAKRLDANTLASAKRAVQSFTIEQQPAEATQVATPPGGWDAKRAQKTAKPGKHKAAKG